MFEVGKEYRFFMIEDGGRSSKTYKIEDVDGVLVKLSSGYDGLQIINTTSQVFISAEEYVRDPEAEERWRDLMPGLPPTKAT